MTRLGQHPITLAILVVCILGTPVTYRGGSAAPHPHMFLQLWQDAGSGDFSHHATRTKPGNHDDHGHLAAANPLPPPVQLAEDRPYPTVSAFVVFDWGVPVLHAPQALPFERDEHLDFRGIDCLTMPAGRSFPPESPPPRVVSF